MPPQGRVIILTGASHGIGLASARRLARAGCRLLLAARHEGELAHLGAHLGLADGRVLWVPTDMSDPLQARRLPERAMMEYGRLDVVVNNAGVGMRGPVISADVEDARYVMDVNYFGPLALIQAAVPLLASNADGGLILNVGSIASRRAGPYAAGYAASKAALERMSEVLRLELRSRNVRVTMLHPGPTETNFTGSARGELWPRVRKVPTVSADRVARALLRALRSEPRDAYVTWLDRAVLAAAAIAPSAMDRLLGALFS